MAKCEMSYSLIKLHSRTSNTVGIKASVIVGNSPNCAKWTRGYYANYYV